MNFHLWETFLNIEKHNIPEDGEVYIAITDNVLEDEDYGYDILRIKQGIVADQMSEKKGIYEITDFVGKTIADLVEWTQFDNTGSHPESYNLIFIKDRQ